MKRFLITGGAGFIGSCVIRKLITETEHEVLNLDKLTYAGNLAALSEIQHSPRYNLERIDICCFNEISSAISHFKPDIIMHLAAESHVDRSIVGSRDFIQTNIVGTFTLLEAARDYFQKLSNEDQQSFRFHHISTDEVYGDLGSDDGFFTELTSYNPSSPYSASKASSDHLVRAWSRTYNLPFLLTNCSNNYGPFQNSEKFIPTVIRHAIDGHKIPIYGSGEQIRDWLYVEDHAAALIMVALSPITNVTYNIGGHNEYRNIDVANMICDYLDSQIVEKPSCINSFRELISNISDRPGHDFRYAIDASKIREELNWVPSETFVSGLQKTVDWYLTNNNWLRT